MPWESKEAMTKKRWPERFYTDPGFTGVPCNDCKHYFGFAKCVVYPERIPGERLRLAFIDPEKHKLPCIEDGGIQYEPTMRHRG